MASDYPASPKSIGEHLRKRRKDLNLLQREVAALVGVDACTVFNWEAQSVEPNLRAWPAVIQFLGYDPRPPGGCIGDKLRLYREGLGLSLDDAAKKMGVNPSTVRKWEARSDAQQNHYSVPRIIAFIGYDILGNPASACEQVRYYRLRLGLTQLQLAVDLGTCQRIVSQWEMGKSVPPTRLLAQLPDRTLPSD